MNATLERENETAEKTRHDAEISAVYRELISGNSSELQKKIEEKYTFSPINTARKPVYETEMTFSDVVIPEEEMIRSAKANRPQSVLVANSATVEKPKMQDAAEEENELSRPTGTTLQYLSLSQKSEVSVQASDAHKYAVSMLLKAIVIFAVAVVAAMVVIAINSGVLSGMDMQLSQLEQSVSAANGQLNAVRDAIVNERSWESIEEFIQLHGMIVTP